LSIPTSSCLLLLSLAVIFGRPEGTFVRLLFHDSAGGRTSRRFLPWAVMIPLWLGFFSSLATDAGLLEERVRLDLFAVAMVMVACALVIGAGWTQVLQQERENLAKRRLRGVVAGLETAVFLGRSREDMTAMNPRAERMLRADGGAPTLAGVAFHALQDRAVLTGPDHPLMRAVDGGGPVFAGWMDGTGGERVLEFTAHPLDDPALPETVVAVHDVTGPWLLRENLSLADRREAISDIAQGYAHELTNIFGIIKLAAGTSQLNAPDFAVESLRSIESACRRGGYLVDRMQALTREGHAQSQPTDAAEVLSEAVVSARDALGPGVSMVADIPEVALPVACDPVDLEIALKNLVANAEDAIREGGEVDGRIVVRLVPGEQSLALHVRDTGPGIPPEVAAHATEPFFTTRRSRGGVGLGLSIVETLANRLGGTFVIGPAKGRGTEAVLTLPLSAERGAETDDATRPPASRLDGISVLVAEDDREFQSMLADTLRKLGATVTHVANGAEALAHLRDHPETDVLVADYLLEGDMTGHDLAVAARAAGSRARVVYLSGYLERGRKPLPDAPGLMLRKPVSLGLLSNSIRLAARSVPRDQPRS
jgi:signal transduction histidine kinase/CheY-like chemotaxis protein